MTPDTVKTQITPAEAQQIAAEAIKELIELKYSQVERWTRMFPGDRIPAQARRDGERRALLLGVAEMLGGAK